MNPFSRKDFTNTYWFILEKLCQLAAGIYIIPQIFNKLGVFNSGEFEVSKSIVGVLSPLFFLGLSAICIRELVMKPKLRHFIIGTTIVLRLFSFMLLALAILCFVYFNKTNEITLIVLIIMLSYLFKISDVVEYYLIANKAYKLVFITKIIILASVLCLQYYGLINNYGVYFFSCILVVEAIIQSIIYSIIFSTSSHLSFSKLKPSLKMAKRLIKWSFPLLISNFIIVFYIAIDDFFVNYFLGSEANGSFSVVQFLVIFITWNIGSAFIYGLYPAIAKCYLVNELKYMQQMIFMLKALIVFGICIGLFYQYFGDYIVTSFYDKSFYNAKLPLKIFAWCPLVIFIGMLFEKHLINENKIERNVYRFIIGCIVNIVLCYILIPKYELVGAAFAVLISHFITNIGFVFFFKTYRQQLKLYFKI